MTENIKVQEQARLIAGLRDSLRGRGETVELFETHISTILVAGARAYKFKKPLRFDFLDFSTLEARRFYCGEELRLNRRLAPDIYLGVARIGGTPARPELDGPGAPVDYAVSMRAFEQRALWSARIAGGQLGVAEIDQLAALLARFHGAAARAPAASEWGGPAALGRICADNLDALDALARDGGERDALAAIRQWLEQRRRALADRFARRKAAGFVRECHGDLHSANILTIEGRVAVFDCIEFNDALRWIDVIKDLAFICMDLGFHGFDALAARLLNGYLEAGGDYEGVAVLRYYQTELALVRWKIAALRARQLEPGRAADACAALAAGYRAFSLRLIAPARAAIIITHGFSGSGKSTLARMVVELLGAVQIRSDVERKRMHGVAPVASAEVVEVAEVAAAALYGPAATDATYERLRLLAAELVGAGLPVVVDATFLERDRRRRFEALAAELGVPFFILDIQAGADALRARLLERARRGTDASDAGVAVLARQLEHHAPLSGAELAHALRIDGEAGLEPEAVRRACAPLVAALRGASRTAPGG